jgi:hypothetical protein
LSAATAELYRAAPEPAISSDVCASTIDLEANNNLLDLGLNHSTTVPLSVTYDARERKHPIGPFRSGRCTIGWLAGDRYSNLRIEGASVQ